MKYDRFFTFKINEETWTGYLITDEEIITLNEDDDNNAAAGMVIYKERALYISEGNVDKSTIAHELFHIIIHYLHLGSADLDMDQFEEVIAVWIENDIDKFVKTRNKLYKKFKKLEGSK